jgi:hypothetical protein
MLSIKSFILAITALCVSRLLYVLFQAAKSPLRSVPGPFLARFTRLWIFRRYAAADFHNDNIQLHRKYGTPYSTIHLNTL